MRCVSQIQERPTWQNSLFFDGHCQTFWYCPISKEDTVLQIMGHLVEHLSAGRRRTHITAFSASLRRKNHP